MNASSPFHAQVVTARLGAAGIVSQVRGVGSTWPLDATVEVLVERSGLEEATELLLADQVDASFAAADGDRSPAPALPLWAVAVIVTLIVATALAPRWT